MPLGDHGLPLVAPSGMKEFTYVAPPDSPLRDLYPENDRKEIDCHDGTIWFDKNGEYSADGKKYYYWYGLVQGLSSACARLNRGECCRAGKKVFSKDLDTFVYAT